MTTSLAPTLSLRGVVPLRTRWFFRYKLRRALYRRVVAEFRRLEEAGTLTRKDLAARLGKKNASIITRWFGRSGNWELDTISDLLVGMGIDPTTILMGDEP